jgi:hypothetical protein
VEKGHAIAMDGLQQQLQKSLAANIVLEEQLKDQERQGLKKDKEIEDLRKAAAELEKQHAGFNEVLNHFQDTLLGTITFHTAKFAISAMPYMMHLLFPLCSHPGARRGGFRRGLAHGHQCSEEGARWPSQRWSPGLQEPADRGFIQPLRHWADAEAIAHARAGGGLEIVLRLGWCQDYINVGQGPLP